MGECCVGCKCAKTGPIPFEYPRVFKKNLIPRLFPFIVSFSRCNAHAHSPDSTSSAEEVSGNIDDVITLARKLLNRAVVSRLVPKQECMVELDKLPLILCTETIESISLSGSYKLTSDTHNGLVAKYRKIAAKNPNLSLSDLFQQQIGSKNTLRKLSFHIG